MFRQAPKKGMQAERAIGAQALKIVGYPDASAPITPMMLVDQAAFDVEHIASIYSLGSEACRVDHFLSPRYRYWCEQIRGAGPQFHRKQWEWVYICAALHERGKLSIGMRGLGFGVGQEPLADLFASLGVTVLATDQSTETAVQGGWVQTGQHVNELSQLRLSNIAQPADFAARVTFRHADMNAIDADLRDFDFCWSSCCYEHLGSIDKGLQFIHNSMRTLRPGGVSIHTTELNLSSDSHTLESPGLSLFRKSDFRRLAHELRSAGHTVAPLCFYPGAHPLEKHIDLPPYGEDPHLRLEVSGYVTTSFGLIVTKGD
jgi:2-polyprenyl-3-methyl-5-hydroxy-6-metoxy-1,4-benzoquinol methylase